MNKFKKIILLVLTVTLIKLPFLSASADNIVDNIGNIVYKRSGNKVTASVEVTADGQKRILIIAAYKKGCLERITADSKTVNGTETLTASIEEGDADEITATVIDRFGGKTLTKKAVYGNDTTALEYIRVNGEDIEYDDETNEYWVKYSKEPVTVEAQVSDGSTKATVSDFVLPGNAKIEVVSSSGEKRNITLHLYKSEDELNKLLGLKYKIGKDIYEITDFNSNTKQYKIALPDNVMGVTLMPEAMGDVTCMISNDTVADIGGVALGDFYSTGATAYQYKHKARNNYIPIKNEKTTAYITVASDDKKTEYQIEFTSKQPRLTSFEYVGAAEDSHKPIFVGGSALNNDSGTMLSGDRRWSVGNISKALLGGSCFMLPAENKNGGYWWNEHTSGEYFNFTADTAGKVYILSGNSIINSEYSGWTSGISSVDRPGDTTWATVAKDWNDYNAECFACVMENQDDYARAVDPWIAENEGNDTMLYPIEMRNYAFRSFAAGEKVSIYHTGKIGQNAAKSMVIVVWDGVSGSAEEEEEEEEITDNPPEDDIEDKDKVMSLVFNSGTDTSKNIWKDDSGYKNNLTLYLDDNNKWTENGFMVSGGSAQSTQLPSAVCDAVNSNVFTLQFEISALNSVSGKKCAIFSSNNGEFEIYKSSSNDNVYFKWAGNTTVIKMPYVTAENMVGHLNTIVVDKNCEDETQKIKWYIDGQSLPKTAKMSATDKTVTKIFMSNPESSYEGSVVFKRLVVYKKALELKDITGGGEE